MSKWKRAAAVARVARNRLGYEIVANAHRDAAYWHLVRCDTVDWHKRCGWHLAQAERYDRLAKEAPCTRDMLGGVC
jgi:hypothetical protein